jgi:hypothetical protein
MEQDIPFGGKRNKKECSVMGSGSTLPVCNGWVSATGANRCRLKISTEKLDLTGLRQAKIQAIPEQLHAAAENTVQTRAGSAKSAGRSQAMPL